MSTVTFHSYGLSFYGVGSPVLGWGSSNRTSVSHKVENIYLVSLSEHLCFPLYSGEWRQWGLVRTGLTGCTPPQLGWDIVNLDHSGLPFLWPPLGHSLQEMSEFSSHENLGHCSFPPQTPLISFSPSGVLSPSLCRALPVGFAPFAFLSLRSLPFIFLSMVPILSLIPWWFVRKCVQSPMLSPLSGFADKARPGPEVLLIPLCEEESLIPR